MTNRAARAVITGLLALAAPILSSCAAEAPRPSTATVTVELLDGTPREGCDAQFTGDSTLTEEGRLTNGNGQVTLRAVPGSYTVEIRCAGDTVSQEFTIPPTGEAVEVLVVT